MRSRLGVLNPTPATPPETRSRSPYTTPRGQSGASYSNATRGIPIHTIGRSEDNCLKLAKVLLIGKDTIGRDRECRESARRVRPFHRSGGGRAGAVPPAQVPGPSRRVEAETNDGQVGVQEAPTTRRSAISSRRISSPGAPTRSSTGTPTPSRPAGARSLLQCGDTLRNSARSWRCPPGRVMLPLASLLVGENSRRVPQPSNSF